MRSSLSVAYPNPAHPPTALHYGRGEIRLTVEIRTLISVEGMRQEVLKNRNALEAEP